MARVNAAELGRRCGAMQAQRYPAIAGQAGSDRHSMQGPGPFHALRDAGKRTGHRTAPCSAPHLFHRTTATRPHPPRRPAHPATSPPAPPAAGPQACPPPAGQRACPRAPPSPGRLPEGGHCRQVAALHSSFNKCSSLTLWMSVLMSICGTVTARARLCVCVCYHRHIPPATQTCHDRALAAAGHGSCSRRGSAHHRLGCSRRLLGQGTAPACAACRPRLRASCCRCC